jgi:hypothetical protein
MKDLGAWPLPAAITAMVRPEATDRSSSSSASSSPGRANSSRCLIRSQLLRLPLKRQSAQILACDEQKIEGEEDQLISLAVCDGGAKRSCKPCFAVVRGAIRSSGT